MIYKRAHLERLADALIKIDGTLNRYKAAELVDMFLVDERQRELADPSWISIENDLPKMWAKDLHTGTEIEVRDAKGNVGESVVGDHGPWYYMAKENGITHWRYKTKTE